MEGLEGNRTQPVAHASFDAWIKAYRPNENSSNTTISYYSKGALVAVVLDAMIIEHSKGKKSLDDLMQKLYSEYYEKDFTGMTPAQFQSTLEDFVGKNMDDFFENYVYGTETIPYADYFEPLGVKIKKIRDTRVGMGISMRSSGGRLAISKVIAGSPAEQAGLSPKDEIIAFNGFRVDHDELSNFFKMLTPGQEFNLIISRDKQLMTIDAQLGEINDPTYEIKDDSNKLGDYWLRQMPRLPADRE